MLIFCVLLASLFGIIPTTVQSKKFYPAKSESKKFRDKGPMLLKAVGKGYISLLTAMLEVETMCHFMALITASELMDFFILFSIPLIIILVPLNYWFFFTFIPSIIQSFKKPLAVTKTGKRRAGYKAHTSETCSA